MQRKEILKGKVYRAKGGILVRAVDTSASPIRAQVYDFISQTYSTVEVKPVDIFGPVKPDDPTEIIDAYETLNNAHDTRQLLAQIDAFNEGFKTEAVGPNRVARRATIQSIADVTVEVPLDGYGRAVEALALPAKGHASIPGDEFIRFTVSHGLALVPVEDRVVGGYPGIPLASLTTENVDRMKAEKQAERDRRARAYKVMGDTKDVLKAEAEAAYVPVEGKRKPYLTYRDAPDHDERIRAALREKGLEEYYR